MYRMRLQTENVYCNLDVNCTKTYPYREACTLQVASIIHHPFMDDVCNSVIASQAIYRKVRQQNVVIWKKRTLHQNYSANKFQLLKNLVVIDHFQNGLFLEETKRKLSTYLSDAPLLACMAGIVR